MLAQKPSHKANSYKHIDPWSTLQQILTLSFRKVAVGEQRELNAHTPHKLAEEHRLGRN